MCRICCGKTLFTWWLRFTICTLSVMGFILWSLCHCLVLYFSPWVLGTLVCSSSTVLQLPKPMSYEEITYTCLCTDTSICFLHKYFLCRNLYHNDLTSALHSENLFWWVLSLKRNDLIHPCCRWIFSHLGSITLHECVNAYIILVIQTRTWFFCTDDSVRSEHHDKGRSSRFKFQIQ